MVIFGMLSILPSRCRSRCHRGRRRRRLTSSLDAAREKPEHGPPVEQEDQRYRIRIARTATEFSRVKATGRVATRAPAPSIQAASFRGDGDDSTFRYVTAGAHADSAMMPRVRTTLKAWP
jgi:hypothetical protein